MVDTKRWACYQDEVQKDCETTFHEYNTNDSIHEKVGKAKIILAFFHYLLNVKEYINYTPRGEKYIEKIKKISF